ncbi:iron complex outermembrane receptor protein [Roseimicrobium gellanilyticum]|uniref:Iron complex outermembrane receptor protein n=1 Tax=Roseimicrobium gellanilyticum TaxID=748857 RepID=A0A366HQI1_9BACT|nr:TonB-dependent receptor [Roseimicrobium gellanilyticum]RBP45910.1 iron complex outermembrane receptor protein [Roseimicrobium gellanilyticum]
MKKSSLGALVTMLCSTALMAQQPAPASAVPESGTTLPPVVVTADSPSLTVPSIEQVEEAQKLTAGAVNVVDAEEYKTGRAITLKDALDYSPGVFVQPRFGAEESRISIRGSGIQRTFHGRGLKLLQDGVPLNLADGGFDMQAVDPLTAEYIEVYRGANALRYGSTTLGGAINFVLPTGYTAPPLQARFEYGSFNTFRGQLSAAGVEGNFDYFVTGTHYSTDGFRDHSEQSTQRLFSNFGLKLSEAVETRFYLTYVHTDSELPGNLTKEEMYANPEQAARSSFNKIFDNVDSNWKRDFDLFRIANKTTFTLSDDALFTVSSFYAYKELDHPILFVIDQKSHDFGFDFNYVNKADLAGRRNNFIVGLTPTFGFLHDQRYRNVLGDRGDKFADSDQDSMNLDLYLENVHYLTDRFALSLGGQVSYARRENEDNFPVSATDPDNSDTQDWWGFSPKVGFIYDVTDSAQVFFNAARSFEPPSFGELSAAATGGAGLVDLDAQTATTLELGTRGQTPDGRIRWDLAYYYSWLEDELLELSVAPGLTQTVNAGKTNHQGVEFGLDITLLEGLFTKRVEGVAAVSGKSAKNVLAVEPREPDRIVLRQNYLWSNFHFDDDAEFGDNQLPGIPEHYYRAELLYTHPCGFYAGPNLEWTFSDYPVDSANTLDADSYALLGFKIGYRTKKGLSFYVEAKNLTDEIYAATTGVISRAGPFNSNQFLPGDGRSYFFGLEYKF